MPQILLGTSPLLFRIKICEKTELDSFLLMPKMRPTILTENDCTVQIQPKKK